jgi:hypothetical protein
LQTKCLFQAMSRNTPMGIYSRRRSESQAGFSRQRGESDFVGAV